jgi:tRNA(Ile2) C34 agmatinyltransferase TiaS
MTREPVCFYCKHLQEVKGKGKFKCKAYDQIPDEVLFNGHSEIRDDQKGDYVLERVKKNRLLELITK